MTKLKAHLVFIIFDVAIIYFSFSDYLEIKDLKQEIANGASPVTYLFPVSFDFIGLLIPCFHVFIVITSWGYRSLGLSILTIFSISIIIFSINSDVELKKDLIKYGYDLNREKSKRMFITFKSVYEKNN